MHTRNFEGSKEANKAWGKEQRKKQEFSTKPKDKQDIDHYNHMYQLTKVQESVKNAREILNPKSRSNLHINPYQPIGKMYQPSIFHNQDDIMLMKHINKSTI